MQALVSLSFDGRWILSKKDEDILPVEAFLTYITEELNVEILSNSLTDCTFVVRDAEHTVKEIEKQVASLIKSIFKLKKIDDVAELSVTEYTPEANESKAVQEPSVADSTQDTSSRNDIDAVMAKIHALVGAEEFKTLAEECVKVAPGLIKHNAVEAFTHRCYLFAINDGCGLTTYLELFAELLNALGLFQIPKHNGVFEEKIAMPKDSDPISASVSKIFNLFSGDGTGKIACLDICEWMNNPSDHRFRQFLSTIEDNLGKSIIIFKVPFVEKTVLTELRNALSDILMVRDLSFVPFAANELEVYARKALDTRGYTMDESAWDVFHARITEEKNDGRFYGVNTVDKVVRDMIYHKQLNNAMSDVDDTIIKVDEIAEISTTFGREDSNSLATLKSMVGMETVCERVQEIVTQIETACKVPTLNAPCIHMRFVGNPGTGKTTVARVIGRLLKERGILRNGNFFEYSGRSLCGQFVGSTAPKTSAICRDAYGSVLFIDEAYSLYRGGFSTGADYGKEAIDTLIAEMENHRSDLVVIMAGYPEEMDTLMKANAGLESRMPFVIEFPNYNREQLFQIFMNMVSKSFTYDAEFEQAAHDYFSALPEDLITSKEFSNARFVRNLFERTWGKAAMRAQLNKDGNITLLKQDIHLATTEKEFAILAKKPNRTLGFV